MIVVRVELWSAITGQKTELARMRICNDGTSAGRVRHYTGESFVGRSAADLDRQRVSKRGAVRDWRALDFHIWNLVATMLKSMGYRDQRRSRIDPNKELAVERQLEEAGVVPPGSAVRLHIKQFEDGRR